MGVSITIQLLSFSADGRATERECRHRGQRMSRHSHPNPEFTMKMITARVLGKIVRFKSSPLGPSLDTTPT